MLWLLRVSHPRANLIDGYISVSPKSPILSEEAILLAGSDGLSSQGSNLAKLLDFFGVSWRVSTLPALLSDQNINGSGLRVLCSSDQFGALMADLGRDSDRARRWREQVHSAFVYAGDDVAALDKMVKTLQVHTAAVSPYRISCLIFVE